MPAKSNRPFPVSRDDAPAARFGASPRLYQRAFDILARQIETGALPAGTRLLESRLTGQFGISRAPARQALAALEHHGLVEKAAGRGYVVTERRPGTAESPQVPAEPVMLSALPTWEVIYREVEREIAARVSFGSWRVVETKLAGHYQVSRTVARDVLGRLQQRGVVRKDERARWYAPALSPKHVGELYELRWLLEPAALAKAAPNAPAALFRQMRRNLQQALASGRTLEGAELDRLEEELHIVLLGHCDSASLMQAITLPQSLLIAHRFLYKWTARLFDVEPFLAEHLLVIEALEHGHVAAAASALTDHLKVSRDRAIARIEVVAKSFDPDPLSYLERID